MTDLKIPKGCTIGRFLWKDMLTQLSTHEGTNERNEPVIFVITCFGSLVSRSDMVEGYEK